MMKKFKRMIALMATFALVLSSAMSYAAATNIKEVTVVPSKLSVILLSEEITPRGTVRTFSIDIPADGDYHVISSFEGEYQKNTKLSVRGTWKPSYGEISVSFKDEISSASVDSFIKSGESAQFTLWADSTWGLYVKATTVDVSGTLQVTVS